MKYMAEYVGPGHPDRLADTIVAKIVDYVISKDEKGLCSLECAVNNYNVYITGRIAAGNNKCVINKRQVKEIVEDVYKQAMFCKEKGFEPFYQNLRIIDDICYDKLSNEERNIRVFSDDQCICIGYAYNDELTNYMPIEHYIAIDLGYTLRSEILDQKNTGIGLDYKLLVVLDETNGVYRWDHITVSILNKIGYDNVSLINFVCNQINSRLHDLFDGTKYQTLSNIEEKLIEVNSGGDFNKGGPIGDNGLSGKKLVIDYYGPRVEIGGGAIWGKDPHKVDVIGSFIAREVAVDLVKKYKYKEVKVKVCFSPGKECPDYIVASYKDAFGIESIVPKERISGLSFYTIDAVYKRFEYIFKIIKHTLTLWNLFSSIQ